MRVYDNGIYRDATPEEIAEFENQRAEAPAESDEITADELMEMLEDVI